VSSASPRLLAAGDPRASLTAVDPSQALHASIRRVQEHGGDLQRPPLRTPPSAAADPHRRPPCAASPLNLSLGEHQLIPPEPITLFWLALSPLPRPAHRTPASSVAAEPPSPSRGPFPAPNCLPVASSALRTLRRSSTATANPERTPGAPDWLSPASSPPRGRAPATQRRRPRSSSPLDVRSCVGDPD
jgi:hypothetical protein